MPGSAHAGMIEFCHSRCYILRFLYKDFGHHDIQWGDKSCAAAPSGASSHGINIGCWLSAYKISACSPQIARSATAHFIFVYRFSISSLRLLCSPSTMIFHTAHHFQQISLPHQIRVDTRLAILTKPILASVEHG